MIKLIDVLFELVQSQHYVERKNERGTIVDITLPEEAYGEYDKKEAKEKLIPILQQELDSKLAALEAADYEASKQKNVVVRFFNPTIIRDLKEYKILMITAGGKKDLGYCYLAFVINDQLATVYPTTADSVQEIKDKMNDHEKRELKNGREAAVYLPKSADVKIDIDELFGKEKQKTSKIDIANLDYTVRGDYRKGVRFEQEPFDTKYGPGIIISGDKGGFGGVDGSIDWVEIQHPKPVAIKRDSKGNPTPVYTRRYGPVLTKTYFDLAKKKQPAINK